VVLLELIFIEVSVGDGVGVGVGGVGVPVLLAALQPTRAKASSTINMRLISSPF